MLLVILIVVLLLSFGGGAYGHGQGWGVGGWSPFGLILLVFVALWLTGNLHGWR